MNSVQRVRPALLFEAHVNFHRVYSDRGVVSVHTRAGAFQEQKRANYLTLGEPRRLKIALRTSVKKTKLMRYNARMLTALHI